MCRGRTAINKLPRLLLARLLGRCGCFDGRQVPGHGEEAVVLLRPGALLDVSPLGRLEGLGIVDERVVTCIIVFGHLRIRVVV